MEANLVPLTPAFLQEVDAPLAPPTLVLVPGKRKLSQFRLRRPLASEGRSSYSSTLLTYVFLRGILNFLLVWFRLWCFGRDPVEDGGSSPVVWVFVMCNVSSEGL